MDKGGILDEKKHAQTAVRRSGGSHGDGHVLHRLCLHLPFRLLEAPRRLEPGRGRQEHRPGAHRGPADL